MEEKENVVQGIDISDKEYKEIVKKAMSSHEIRSKGKERLLKSASNTDDYKKELEEKKIPGYDKKVIFTDGAKQLIFDNGEFFEVSTTDATKEPVKITRKEATDRYIEYYINNVLNPLIARKEELGIVTDRKQELEDIKKQVNDEPTLNTSKKEPKSKDDDLEMEI